MDSSHAQHSGPLGMGWKTLYFTLSLPWNLSSYYPWYQGTICMKSIAVQNSTSMIGKNKGKTIKPLGNSLENMLLLLWLAGNRSPFMTKNTAYIGELICIQMYHCNSHVCVEWDTNKTLICFKTDDKQLLIDPLSASPPFAIKTNAVHILRVWCYVM